MKKLSGVSVSCQCCFTSTETVWTVRDSNPWTSTSIFTLLLSSNHGITGRSNRRVRAANHLTTSANQNVAFNIPPREKREEWWPRFHRTLKHINRAKGW